MLVRYRSSTMDPTPWDTVYRHEHASAISSLLTLASSVKPNTAHLISFCHRLAGVFMDRLEDRVAGLAIADLLVEGSLGGWTKERWLVLRCGHHAGPPSVDGMTVVVVVAAIIIVVEEGKVEAAVGGRNSIASFWPETNAICRTSLLSARS